MKCKQDITGTFAVWMMGCCEPTVVRIAGGEVKDWTEPGETGTGGVDLCSAVAENQINCEVVGVMTKTIVTEIMNDYQGWDDRLDQNELVVEKLKF